VTGWRTLRKQVYARDRGVCQVCHLRVGRLWDAGHLVDRIVGGEDALDNLVLMCVRCNRSEKPIHRTRAEVDGWLNAREKPVGDTWRPVWNVFRVEV
jgi:5-methylcytosine-specific restriction endonuclease McrA